MTVFNFLSILVFLFSAFSGTSVLAQSSSNSIEENRSAIARAKSDEALYQRQLQQSEQALEGASNTRNDPNRVARLMHARDIAQARLEAVQNLQKRYQSFIVEAELNQKQKDQFQKAQIECDASLPTVDLEETGIFKNQPHDYQSNLNTCYANTAKNLLLAASDGKVDASFLDLSLQFKLDSKSNLNPSGTTDLGYGSSCAAIDAVKRVGYCRRTDSPLERGEDLSPVKGIDGLNKMVDQKKVINALSDFLGKAKTNEVADDFDVKYVVETLKSNRLIELPYPTLGIDFLDRAKLEETYYWGLEPGQKDRLTLEQYHSEIVGLKKRLDQKIVAGKKKQTPVTQLRQELDAEISRWRIEMKIKSDTKPFFNLDAESLKSVNIGNYEKRADETEKFYAKLLSKRQSDLELDQILNGKACSTTDSKNLRMMNELKSLITVLQENNMDSSDLLNGKKLKSNQELFQLAVAPKCINPANRVKISGEISCQQIGTEELAKRFGGSKTDVIRFSVLEELKKGLVLGNGFAKHINTIVGIRFNPQSRACEYKIRESMTGQSTWQNEEQVSFQMADLTFIRRSL